MQAPPWAHSPDCFPMATCCPDRFRRSPATITGGSRNVPACANYSPWPGSSWNGAAANGPTRTKNSTSTCTNGLSVLGGSRSRARDRPASVRLSDRASVDSSRAPSLGMAMKAYAILDGGGVKGAALAGCLKAAEELGIEFAGYGGTSAGSIVALLAAVGYTGDELLHMLVDELDFTCLLDDGGQRL